MLDKDLAESDGEKTLESKVDSVEEKRTLPGKIVLWLKNRYHGMGCWFGNRRYEPFFPDDEKSLEVYTRNRQVGGA